MKYIHAIFLAIVVQFAVLWSATSAHAEFETTAKYAYMLDAQTGAVLLDKNSAEAMNPSSMSKLMTLYVLFDELKRGNITLETPFKVSENAWKKGGSKMFVHMDTDVLVEDLIRGIIVQSGNDACIVVAENIAGSEEQFANRMNAAAKEIGLTQSHFKNATGWPDPEHVMSAQDIAKLSAAIIRDFPDYYPYFAEKEFTYANITQQNRNRLVGGGLGVDGLKTGHTEVAGYGIALAAKDSDSGRRVILVINGLDSDSARIGEGAKLLSYGLKGFDNQVLARKDQVLGELPVWFGTRDRVKVAVGADLVMTIDKSAEQPTASIQAMTPVKSPIKAGDQLATLVLTQSDGAQRSVPLVATQDVDKATGLRWFKAFIFQHMLDHG